MFRKKKSRKEQLAENEAFASIITKKVDAIFQPQINKINKVFNNIKLTNKYLIISIVFIFLLILTYKQWKQIAP